MATRSERQHKTDQNGVHFHGTHLEHKLPRHTQLRKSSHGLLPLPPLFPLATSQIPPLYIIRWPPQKTDNFACFSAWTAPSVCQWVCAGVCVCFSVSDGHVCLLPQCVCFFSFCALNFLCFVATVAISCYCIFKQPAFLFSFYFSFPISFFDRAHKS